MPLRLPQPRAEPLDFGVVFLADFLRLVQKGFVVLSESPQPLLVGLADFFEFFAQLPILVLQLLSLVGGRVQVFQIERRRMQCGLLLLALFEQLDIGPKTLIFRLELRRFVCGRVAGGQEFRLQLGGRLLQLVGDFCDLCA